MFVLECLDKDTEVLENLRMLGFFLESVLFYRKAIAKWVGEIPPCPSQPGSLRF